MNINHFIKYCLGILSVICLYACQPDTVYFAYKPVPSDGWSKKDTLQFYLPDTLSAGTYHLEVGVRHTGKYPYRDLWLELTHYIPNPAASHKWKECKDTIHIYLANEKGGWNGTGTTSGHFQLLAGVGELTIAEDMVHDEENGLNLSKEDQQQSKGISVPLQKKVKSKREKYTFEGKPHVLGKQVRHHLKVVHIMTDSLLLHISDVGLRLTDSSTVSDQTNRNL